MPFWVVLLAASTALAATGFVVVSLLWFKKLRSALHTAVGEMANQQIRSAKKFSDAVGQLQKQQRALDRQVQNLAQSLAGLRQDVAVIATRVESGEREQRQPGPERILH